MPPICLFKQSALAQAVHMHNNVKHHHVINYQNVQRIFSASLCFMAMQSVTHAVDLSVLQPEITNDAALSSPQQQKIEALLQKAQQQKNQQQENHPPKNQLQKNDNKPRDSQQIEPNLEQRKTVQKTLNSTNGDPLNQPIDSEILLQQQLDLGTIPNFQAITFAELENMPNPTVDQNLVNQIYQVAEQAQNEAQSHAKSQAQTNVPQVNRSNASYVAPISPSEMQAIQQAPINVDGLMQSIQQDNNIQVGENLQGQVVPNVEVKNATQPQPQLSVWQRIINRFKPTLDSSAIKVPRISVNVNGAPADLARNIDAKLSTYTQEAFEDYAASLPQLRILANQAAQAMGYYHAEFKFNKVSDSAVRVDVTPNEPVKITLQNIEFTGEGRSQPQFRIIPLIPEQEVGDLFNHGLYEQTKLRMSTAASDNGYFDAYWRLHDAKVTLPDNTADIHLKYETGERYQLGQVEFRMSDPNKPLPLDLDILNSLAPWQAGDDYAFWRVNTLANNLTNSRYFNYTLADSIRPDPISKPLELAPDLQALADQEQMQRQQNLNQSQAEATSSEEVQQNVVDEAKFAGIKNTTKADANVAARTLQVQQTQKASDNELLQQQARLEKKIPIVVTLNADKLNSLETGLGYGTDTGVRLRSQYRRSIVNKRGHAFDSNIELSQIRQSLDARYSIPYHHPLNDYFNLITGYERETRDDIGPNVNLITEALVLGAERVIKNPIGDWQHDYGLRYRLDRLTQEGITDANNIPDEFRLLGTEQQSLLLSYETSKTDSDNAVNPTVGFKQSYKIEVGSKTLLSDTDMVILTAGWRTIYSLGEDKDHQVLGRADAAYIFSNDFEKVPYNLRYFTGGDQTIRGFDYKSLGPQIDGFKIGGEALAVGSLEYNYQFRDGWRAAVFSDFGNAYDEKFSNSTAYSAGVGLRWKSPIGSIRIDVASGISDPNHPIRLHFFIGPQL